MTCLNFRYPTKEDFTAVAMEIICKYPFLKSKVSPATVIYTICSRNCYISFCYVYAGCYSSNSYK